MFARARRQEAHTTVANSWFCISWVVMCVQVFYEEWSARFGPAWPPLLPHNPRGDLPDPRSCSRSLCGKPCQARRVMHAQAILRPLRKVLSSGKGDPCPTRPQAWACVVSRPWEMGLVTYV